MINRIKRYLACVICSIMVLQTFPSMAKAMPAERVEPPTRYTNQSDEQARQAEFLAELEKRKPELKEEKVVINPLLMAKPISLQSSEKRPFTYYFPDPHFARTIARLGFERTSEDLVSIDELQSIEHINFWSDAKDLSGIEYLSNLKYLFVRNTPIRNLPESISKLRHIEELYLIHVPLISLPDSIGELTKLKELGLTSLPLRSMPKSIGNLKQLELFIFYNGPSYIYDYDVWPYEYELIVGQISTLPESIGNLSRLKECSIQGTGITELPESIGKLNNLEILEMRWNQFRSLPDTIGNLQSLISLGLQQNNISALPDSLGDLKNLVWLHLEDNKLTRLPDTVGNLEKLEGLYLRGNFIASLPDSIGDLEHLFHIDLCGNQLLALPPSLVHKLDKVVVDTCFQNATLPKKLVDKADLGTVLPDLVWQLFLSDKAFFQYPDGQIISGKITVSKGDYSKEVSIEDVLFDPDFTVKDLLTFGAGIYDIAYETCHNYQYQVELREDAAYTQVFAGTARSNLGIYQINLSGSFDLKLQEGKNALTFEQIASLAIRGTAMNLSNVSETAAITQTRITGGNIWVNGGKIEKIELAGRAKTATGKNDDFVMTMSAASALSSAYSVTGSSVNGQYQVAFSGKIPENLSEGWNTFARYELTGLVQNGIILNKQNKEIKFLNNNNIFTNIVFYVSNKKVVSISITGQNKTPSGTLEPFSISAKVL